MTWVFSWIYIYFLLLQFLAFCIHIEKSGVCNSLGSIGEFLPLGKASAFTTNYRHSGVFALVHGFLSVPSIISHKIWKIIIRQMTVTDLY